MKKSLLLIPLLLLGSFTFASDNISSFPSFPMTIYGNIKIWSSDLNWWTLKVYDSSNKELSSYDITQKWKYWSDNVSILPLLLNEFKWNLVFKVLYNWKTYVVDSIDDSERWSRCPSKTSITFVTENCKYNIILKEESQSNSWSSSSWGWSSSSWGWSSSSWGWSSSSWGWGWKSSSSTDKINLDKNTTNTWNVVENKTNDKTENKNENKTGNKTKSNNNTSNNNWSKNTNWTSGWDRIPAQVFTFKSSEYLNWNPWDILDNGYTREMNNAYQFTYKNWITTSNSIDKAKMNEPLTRIAMAKILSNYAINILWKKPDPSLWTVKFDDVTEKQNADYDNAVTLAYQLWIMGQNIKNNKFRPNDEVTRAEFATAFSRLLYSTSDWNPYYTNHLRILKQKWIITNDNPNIKEKRWYVMVMLMRTTKS